MSDTPDPRELARRVVEEAKARAAAKAAEEALARAAAEAAAKPAPAAPTAPPEPERRSLADRATRAKSPEEAMREAIAREEAALAARQLAKKVAADAALRAAQHAAEEAARLAAEHAAAEAAEAAALAPVAPPEPVTETPAAPAEPFEAWFSERVPGAVVSVVKVADHRVVFQALWQAHRARAFAERNLALLVTAEVLLDASRRLPPGALLAVRFTWPTSPGGPSEHAAWIDATTRSILTSTGSPELYLAGL
jgi:hypothetical protein